MRAVTLISFYLLLISYNIEIQSQREYFLEGKIGNASIYLNFSDDSELDTSNDTPLRGTYFYQSSLKDIVILGEVVNNVYTFKVEAPYDHIAETFILYKKDDRFTGTWTNDKAKSLRVELFPLKMDQINNRFDHINWVKDLKKSDPFNYVRSSLIELKRDSIQNLEGKSFVWFSEKHCEAPFFRLGNGFNKQKLENINPLLDNIHFQNIISQLTCSTKWSYNDGNNIDYQSSINYLDNNLIGFEVFSSWYCGGAHPDFGGVGYLIDLNNGKNYQISDVYSIEPSELFELINDEEHFIPSDSDDVCDYTIPDIFNYTGWNFTKRGVEFTPIFPRFARACETPFLAPYYKLEKYKNRNFPYNFLKLNVE